MIELSNAEKFSPAYGFEPDVVVEVTYEETGSKTIGFYIGSNGTYGQFIRLGSHDGPFDVGFADIKSLRILSGLWAMWQFAPKEAVVMVIREHKKDPEELRIQFLHQHSWDHLRHHVDNPGAVVYEAPWWWLEAQK